MFLWRFCFLKVVWKALYSEINSLLTSVPALLKTLRISVKNAASVSFNKVYLKLQCYHKFSQKKTVEPVLYCGKVLVLFAWF